MGFINFLKNLLKSSNKDIELNASRSVNVRKKQQGADEDMDDLDFDEMNDVWDEE